VRGREDEAGGGVDADAVGGAGEVAAEDAEDDGRELARVGRDAAAAREQGKPANSEFAWGGYKQPDQAALPVVDGYRTVPDSYDQATKLWSLTEEIRKDWKITRRTEAVKDYFGDATVAKQMMYAL
jgi:hypothetical protein